MPLCTPEFVASDSLWALLTEFDENGFLPLIIGDLVLAFLQSSDTGNTPTPPSGWQTLPESPVVQGSSAALWGFFKVIEAGDSGVYDFGSGAGWLATFVEYRGVDVMNPIADVSKAANGDSTPTLTLPSVTSSQNNSMLVVATSNEIVDRFEPSEVPTVDGFNWRTFGQTLVFEKVQAVSGASGSVDVDSFDPAGNGWDIGFLISVSPPSIGCSDMEQVCETINYGDFIDESKFDQGPNGFLEDNRPTDDFDPDPAALSSQALTTTGDTFKFQSLSYGEQGAHLCSIPTRLDGGSLNGWGFYFGGGPVDGVVVEFEGGAVSGTFPYELTDVFSIRRNSGGTVSFFRNQLFIWMSQAPIDTENKLNLSTAESMLPTYRAGFDNVQFCADGEVPSSGSRFDCSAIDSQIN